MAFFPRSSQYGHSASFNPLFRLLDEFDNYSRQDRTGSGAGHEVAHWQPKFDVRETAATYELYGELPGVSKDNVSIEFPEPQSITVSGKTERTYTTTTTTTPTTTTTTDGDDDGSKAADQDEQSPDAKDKYWLTERSIGQFSRSFNFPTRIDTEAVSAKLEDGILRVVVPKAKKHETRKVTVN